MPFVKASERHANGRLALFVVNANSRTASIPHAAFWVGSALTGQATAETLATREHY